MNKAPSKKLKLTPNQVTLIARYMAASNLGTMESHVRVPRTDVVAFVNAYYSLARQNHSEEGIDIGDEFRSFTRDVSKRPAYWAGEFEKEFGAGSLDKIA